MVFEVNIIVVSSSGKSALVSAGILVSGSEA